MSKRSLQKSSKSNLVKIISISQTLIQWIKFNGQFIKENNEKERMPTTKHRFEKKYIAIAMIEIIMLYINHI